MSRYISPPHLLDHHKYDLRLYVLITSYDPLRIYLYNNGLVRFATERYSVTSKACKRRYVHLTNYAVNKKAPKFVGNQKPEVPALSLIVPRPMASVANGVLWHTRKGFASWASTCQLSSIAFMMS